MDKGNDIETEDGKSLLDKAGQESSVHASDEKRRKPRIDKFRVGLVLLGLLVLAVISTVFGMMMASSSRTSQP